MVIVMDMSTGEKLEQQLESNYTDEVLCANWLPQPTLDLALASAVPAHADAQAPLDPEAWLRAYYRAQE